MPSRDQIFSAIMRDYPTILPEFVSTFLDMVEKDPDYIEGIIKERRKKEKRVPEPKNQLTVDEVERLQAKMKELPQGTITVTKHEESEPSEISHDS